MTKIQPMQTVGVIAKKLHVSVHQVEYLIRSRQIEPTAIAGNARVFAAIDVDRIAAELQRIAELKQK